MTKTVTAIALGLAVNICLTVATSAQTASRWDDKIDQIETAEQVCIWGSIREQREKFISQRITRYKTELLALRQEFSAMHIDTESLKDTDLAWQEVAAGKTKISPSEAGASAFVEEFDQSDELDRCHSVKAAYYFAVMNMNCLLAGTAGKQVGSQSMSPNMPDYLTQEQVERDRRRAAWPFRYIVALQQQDIPIACLDTYNKGMRRFRFIFDSFRPPLGYMLQACGRSQNAHYLDQDVVAGILPTPEGWKHPISVDDAL